MLKQFTNSGVQVAKLKRVRIDRNSKDHTNSIHTQLNFKDPLSSFSYVHCMHLVTSHKHFLGIWTSTHKCIAHCKANGLHTNIPTLDTQMKHVNPRPPIQKFIMLHLCCKHTRNTQCNVIDSQGKKNPKPQRCINLNAPPRIQLQDNANFLPNFMFNNKLQTLQQQNMNHDEWATHKTRIKYLIP